MKRIIKVFVLLLVLLISAGCSRTPSPTDVVKQRLTSMQNDYIDQFSKEVSNSDSSEAEISTYNQLSKMLKQQTYTLDNEKIDGDKATVDAHFKTYNFLASFGNTLTSYLGEVFSMAFSGASEEDMQVKLFEIWNEDLIELEKEGLTKDFDFTFELEKADDGWKVKNMDGNAFIDGYLGGLLSAFEKLSNN